MSRARVLGAFTALAMMSDARAATVDWSSSNQFRILLKINARGRVRSQSPVSVEIDFQNFLLSRGATGHFDEMTLEMFTLAPDVDHVTPRRVPHRLDKLFGATTAILHFVMPDERHTEFVVYFDTIESGRGQPRRYHGLVGDGDRFSEGFGAREIAASHFDQNVDFDGDGDLDLFQGGVEPYVHCFENIGANRFADRGPLSSGGKVFKLPCSTDDRSWVTVAFYDIDGDGDQDFFPSFNDGPDHGKIVFYRNTTREHGGELTFTRVGPLQTSSGVPLAGGAQAGGWFPSITFVRDWEGDGRSAALVGSNNRCWLYRNLGTNADGTPRFAGAVALRADGKEIELVNPRFECADIDGDGDLDLFAGAQPGPIYWFKNIGTRTKPEFAPAQSIAFDGKYLIGDAHSGVKVADFDGDGLLDAVAGRFWERLDLNRPSAPREFGGFFKNVGTRTSPRFVRQTTGGPHIEQFQPCDAIRQNGVRAVDWDGDGRLDLLAGDTDGFVWYFRNTAATGVPAAFSAFAPGEKLLADGKFLSLAASGGHARFDVCDWNNDGAMDLLVADGRGTLTLFLNEGTRAQPKLGIGEMVLADEKPIQGGARASVLVCDWNNDGRKDVIFADEKGYWFHQNTGTDPKPLLAARKPILFGGKPVRYVRPNLGSFVDWDGDGKRDLIGCHFENTIRFYRNIGSSAPNTEPQFADPEGIVILKGESPQMISGAHAVDWNGDGDLDILTGQGHGGSGLRFYERDWIEDELHSTHPVATILRTERKP